MKPPTYPFVLFDLDHTLFDSDESERLAFSKTMRAFGIHDPEALIDPYRSINRALWAQVESGELAVGDVRSERFRRFTAQAGLDVDADDVADRFVIELGANGHLYDGARAVLDVVAASSVVGLITNGLGEVQRERLARTGLEDVFQTVVISGEVGTAKPDSGIFDIAFGELGDPDPAIALMVGDSLTSDIAGAAAYGMATCWVNRHGAPTPSHVSHDIATLDELPGIGGWSTQDSPNTHG